MLQCRIQRKKTTVSSTSSAKENSRIASRKGSRDDLREIGVSQKSANNNSNTKKKLLLSPLETRNENKGSSGGRPTTAKRLNVAYERRFAVSGGANGPQQRRDAPSPASQASTASSRSRYRDANVLVPIRKQNEKLAKSTPTLSHNQVVPSSASKQTRRGLPAPPRPISADYSNRRQKEQGGAPQGEDLSRASSISNLNAETTKGGSGKGALAKVRKSVSKDKLNENVANEKRPSQEKKGCNKNNNQLDLGDHEELDALQQKLEAMSHEKANLMLQLGDQKGQLTNLQKEISRLKMEQLNDENMTLRNKLRDVVHSPLSDNEKQMILLDSQRHHSSAPASIAANLMNDSGGGDATACSTPDWDKQSSSNVSEVSVACLQDKINQMQETHYSTNEELQATLQELTDLQKQLTELQQDNEHLQEEKNLMFESLCRQTERLTDARNEIESLKKLLYRDKDESGHDESSAEREQKLVDLLKNAQIEREMLLVKQEQLNNEIQEVRLAFAQRDGDNLTLAERVGTLECTLDAKHAEHKQLDQDLARAKDKSSSRQIEIDRLNDLLENARTKIAELEQDRALGDKSELDEMLDNARKEKDSLESEVANLKEQLARARNETEKLREQVSILQEECKVLRNNAKCTQSELEYKVELLMAEKNALVEQLQGLEEAANELQVQAQCQLEDKRQLSSVLSETQRNMSEVERRNKELEMDLKEIKKLRSEENEEWDKFQNDLLTSVRVANDFKNEAQQELQNLVLENKAHRDKIRLLESQIEKLKENVGLAMRDAGELKSRIDRLNSSKRAETNANEPLDAFVAKNGDVVDSGNTLVVGTNGADIKEVGGGGDGGGSTKRSNDDSCQDFTRKERIALSQQPRIEIRSWNDRNASQENAVKSDVQFSSDPKSAGKLEFKQEKDKRVNLGRPFFKTGETGVDPVYENYGSPKFESSPNISGSKDIGGFSVSSEDKSNVHSDKLLGMNIASPLLNQNANEETSNVHSDKLLGINIASPLLNQNADEEKSNVHSDKRLGVNIASNAKNPPLLNQNANEDTLNVHSDKRLGMNIASNAKSSPLLNQNANEETSNVDSDKLLGINIASPLLNQNANEEKTNVHSDKRLGVNIVSDAKSSPLLNQSCNEDSLVVDTNTISDSKSGQQRLLNPQNAITFDPQKLPKSPKNLSKREEYYLKFIDEEYSKIDPSIAVEHLQPDQQLIVKLKRGYDRHFALPRVRPMDGKRELAISKPLLASVYDNPKLKEIVESDEVLNVENANCSESDAEDRRKREAVYGDYSGGKVYGDYSGVDVVDLATVSKGTACLDAPLEKSKSKSLGDLTPEESINRDVLKRAFVSQLHVNRDSNMSDYQDSVIYDYSDEEDYEEPAKAALVNPELIDLYERIDRTKPEDELTKEEMYVLQLKRSLDSLGRKNTLRRLKLKRGKLSISSPVLDSVMTNEKLACIIENPGIAIAHSDISTTYGFSDGEVGGRFGNYSASSPDVGAKGSGASWKDRFKARRTNKKFSASDDVVYRYSLNSGAIKIEAGPEEDARTSSSSAGSVPLRSTFYTFGVSDSGRSARSEGAKQAKAPVKREKSASLTDIQFNFGDARGFREDKPHKDRDKAQERYSYPNRRRGNAERNREVGNVCLRSHCLKDAKNELILHRHYHSNPNLPQRKSEDDLKAFRTIIRTEIKDNNAQGSFTHEINDGRTRDSVTNVGTATLGRKTRSVADLPAPTNSDSKADESENNKLSTLHRKAPSVADFAPNKINENYRQNGEEYRKYRKYCDYVQRNIQASRGHGPQNPKEARKSVQERPKSQPTNEHLNEKAPRTNILNENIHEKAPRTNILHENIHEKAPRTSILNENIHEKAPRTMILNDNLNEQAPRTNILNENIHEKAPRTSILNENLNEKAPRTSILNENIHEKAPRTNILNENIREKAPRTSILNENINEKAPRTSILNENLNEKAPRTNISKDSNYENLTLAFNVNETRGNSVDNAKSSENHPETRDQYENVNVSAQAEATEDVSNTRVFEEDGLYENVEVVLRNKKKNANARAWSFAGNVGNEGENAKEGTGSFAASENVWSRGKEAKEGTGSFAGSENVWSKGKEAKEIPGSFAGSENIGNTSKEAKERTGCFAGSENVLNKGKEAKEGNGSLAGSENVLNKGKAAKARTGSFAGNENAKEVVLAGGENVEVKRGSVLNFVRNFETGHGSTARNTNKLQQDNAVKKLKSNFEANIDLKPDSGVVIIPEKYLTDSSKLQQDNCDAVKKLKSNFEASIAVEPDSSVALDVKRPSKIETSNPEKCLTDYGKLQQDNCDAVKKLKNNFEASIDADSSVLDVKRPSKIETSNREHGLADSGEVKSSSEVEISNPEERLAQVVTCGDGSGLKDQAVYSNVDELKAEEVQEQPYSFIYTETNDDEEEEKYRREDFASVSQRYKLVMHSLRRKFGKTEPKQVNETPENDNKSNNNVAIIQSNNISPRDDEVTASFPVPKPRKIGGLKDARKLSVQNLEAYNLNEETSRRIYESFVELKDQDPLNIPQPAPRFSLLHQETAPEASTSKPRRRSWDHGYVNEDTFAEIRKKYAKAERNTDENSEYNELINTNDLISKEAKHSDGKSVDEGSSNGRTSLSSAFYGNKAKPPDGDSYTSEDIYESFQIKRKQTNSVRDKIQKFLRSSTAEDFPVNRPKLSRNRHSYVNVSQHRRRDAMKRSISEDMRTKMRNSVILEEQHSEEEVQESGFNENALKNLNPMEDFASNALGSGCEEGIVESPFEKRDNSAVFERNNSVEIVEISTPTQELACNDEYTVSFQDSDSEEERDFQKPASNVEELENERFEGTTLERREEAVDNAKNEELEETSNVEGMQKGRIAFEEAENADSTGSREESNELQGQSNVEGIQKGRIEEAENTDSTGSNKESNELQERGIQRGRIEEAKNTDSTGSREESNELQEQSNVEGIQKGRIEEAENTDSTGSKIESKQKPPTGATSEDIEGIPKEPTGFERPKEEADSSFNAFKDNEPNSASRRNSVDSEAEANLVLRELTKNFLLIEQIMSENFRKAKRRKTEKPRIVSSAFKCDNERKFDNPEIVITPTPEDPNVTNKRMDFPELDANVDGRIIDSKGDSELDAKVDRTRINVEDSELDAKGRIIESKDSELDGKVEDTIRASKDSAIGAKVDDTIREPKYSEICAKVEDTIRESKDSEIGTKVEDTIRASKDSEIGAKVDDTIRESKDSELDGKVDDTIRESKDSEIGAKVEDTIRESKDSVIGAKVEDTIRASKDSEISAKVDGTIRASKDSEIDGKVEDTIRESKNSEIGAKVEDTIRASKDSEIIGAKVEDTIRASKDSKIGAKVVDTKIDSKGIIPVKKIDVFPKAVETGEVNTTQDTNSGSGIPEKADIRIKPELNSKIVDKVFDEISANPDDLKRGSSRKTVHQNVETLTQKEFNGLKRDVPEKCVISDGILKKETLKSKDVHVESLVENQMEETLKKTPKNIKNAGNLEITSMEMKAERVAAIQKSEIVINLVGANATISGENEINSGTAIEYTLKSKMHSKDDENAQKKPSGDFRKIARMFERKTAEENAVKRFSSSEKQKTESPSRRLSYDKFQERKTGEEMSIRRSSYDRKDIFHERKTGEEMSTRRPSYDRKDIIQERKTGEEMSIRRSSYDRKDVFQERKTGEEVLSVGRLSDNLREQFLRASKQNTRKEIKETTKVSVKSLLSKFDTKSQKESLSTKTETNSQKATKFLTNSEKESFSTKTDTNSQKGTKFLTYSEKESLSTKTDRNSQKATKFPTNSAKESLLTKFDANPRKEPKSADKSVLSRWKEVKIEKPVKKIDIGTIESSSVKAFDFGNEEFEQILNLHDNSNS